LMKNFIENVKYYCEYYSKKVPDDAFIISGRKAGIPLDEIVERFEKARRLGARRSKQTFVAMERRKIQ